MNRNHDPKSGEFSEGPGGGSAGKTGEHLKGVAAQTGLKVESTSAGKRGPVLTKEQLAQMPLQDVADYRISRMSEKNRTVALEQRAKQDRLNQDRSRAQDKLRT